MTGLINLESKIQEFSNRFDYSVSQASNGRVRTYYILSERLKEVVSPFPNLKSELVDIELKTEERDKDANHFSYEKGISGEPDKFTITRNRKLDQCRKSEAERQRSEAEEWARETGFPLNLSVEERKKEVKRRKKEVEKRIGESLSSGDYSYSSFHKKNKGDNTSRIREIADEEDEIIERNSQNDAHKSQQLQEYPLVKKPR